MASTTPSSSLLTLSKSLKFTRSHLHCVTFSTRRVLLTRRQLATVNLSYPSPFRSLSGTGTSVRCASGGGSDGGSIGGSGGGGGGDGSDGGNSKIGGVSGAVDDVSTLSSDVIVLDVRGMTCGGCAAKVKRILENQPQVSSASVNLATETAIVWLASEAKVVPDWQQEVGEMLAKQLTSCGFESNLRGLGEKEGDVQL